MKRMLATLTLLITLVMPMLVAPAVGAVDAIDPAICERAPSPKPAICDPKLTGGGNPVFGPDGVLTNAVKIISLVVGIAAVIAIMLAGIKFMTSMGDPAKVAQARQAIIYAGVGIVVVAMAQLIVVFILSRIGS